MDMISKGDFTEVVHHQGLCYAANRNTMTIHVFEQYANQWKQIKLFSLVARSGTFITLGISNDLIYVCSFEDHRIDTYTLNGVFRFTTGKQGNRAAGELYWPRICDTDASGAALIADFGNDRLHVLGVSGQWRIVQLDPPVKRPWSACLVNDTLYVGHENENGKQFISSYKSE